MASKPNELRRDEQLSDGGWVADEVEPACPAPITAVKADEYVDRFGLLRCDTVLRGRWPEMVTHGLQCRSLELLELAVLSSTLHG